MDILSLSSGLRIDAFEPIEPIAGTTDGTLLGVDEVQAQDTKEGSIEGKADVKEPPPATLMELLTEIFSNDLGALVQQGRPQFKGRNAASELGVRMGEFKAAARSDSLEAVLGAIGIDVSGDFDLSDTNMIKKAVAEQIVSQGLPPNLRGLLATLLQMERPQAPTDDSPTDPVPLDISPVGLPISGDSEPVLDAQPFITDYQIDAGAVKTSSVAIDPLTGLSSTEELGLIETTDAIEPLVISGFEGAVLDQDVTLVLTSDSIQKAFDVPLIDTKTSFVLTA
ncbi:MAG: hypothetical protein IH945_10375 [Armatimonadetes bacterium]|nr:hypothetical protein [Armatimonadota bacterium]